MKSSESVIRLMTRLAAKHDAVNLAQGFPDEPPPPALVTEALAVLLGGTSEGMARIARLRVEDLAATSPSAGGGVAPLIETLCGLREPRDEYNQYSYPFGLLELRVAIADYMQRFYGWRPDPETEITVTLGATEGIAATLGSACESGDGVIVIQPFHEVYPSQARVFGLRPRFVTLRRGAETGRWAFDPSELEHIARRGARLLVLNTPHNPTGKVFDDHELEAVAEICQKHDLLVLTDEIYEHILYDGMRHRCLATLPGMRERTVVVNSISKTANATGWRVGWVISPPALTAAIRGVHDTLVIQAPTPFQKAAVRVLEQPHSFFAQLQQRYTTKRNLLCDALTRAGFRVSPPEGSFYLFAHYRSVPALRDLAPMAAAMTLIERFGVASVPGDNFYAEGDDGGDYLRFAFCRSIDSLRVAGGRLEPLGR